MRTQFLAWKLLILAVFSLVPRIQSEPLSLNAENPHYFTYRGKPATHSCLIAVTPLADGAQTELMQPLTGRSIYDEHLDKHGEGLHHVKLFHADCAKAVERYKRHGYPVIQSGQFDDDVHYYFDTEKDFGYVVEIGNCGKIRDAERRYPA